MATNYNALIKSEEELKKQFFEFLDLAYSIHKKTWTYILSKELDSSKMDDLRNDEESSDAFEKDILDECVWIISKDQPRSNHLRFIISIIYSIKDLERISDYAIEIAESLENKEIDKNNYDFLKPLSNRYLTFFKSFVDLIKKKNVSEYYQTGRDLKNEFFENCNKDLKKLLEICPKNDTSIQNILLIFRSIDRCVHHIYNVFINFKFVKNIK